jgi:hypothetical protein
LRYRASSFFYGTTAHPDNQSAINIEVKALYQWVPVANFIMPQR